MLNAIVTVEDKKKELFRIFELEDKDFGSQRAKYDIEYKDNNLNIKVTAKDSVALRSVLNTVTKIITVYEKTSMVLNKANETRN